jgi:hypothetical protein
MSEIEVKFINSLKERSISDPTIKLYLFQLHQLNDGPIENFKKFEDINYILDKLKKFKINTQKTKIIAIIALLKVFPQQKDLLDKYSEIIGNINKVTNVTNKEKSENQIKNWVTKDEIFDIWNALDNVVNTFTNKKNLSEKQYNLLLQFVVLSLYTLTSPRRNADYSKMLVIKKVTDGLPQDLNYLDLQKRTFIFNNYKTSRVYKQQVEKIPEELFNVLKIYLKYKPNDCPYLLCNFDSTPLKHINSITLILNKIFGKKVGASLLRNIFMSEKFSGLQKQLDELGNTAESMGTSKASALGVYIKK